MMTVARERGARFERADRHYGARGHQTCQHFREYWQLGNVLRDLK
jgi:hypothetical protein